MREREVLEKRKRSLRVRKEKKREVSEKEKALEK